MGPNILIIQKWRRFPLARLKRYDVICAYRSVLDRIPDSKARKVEIPDDLMTARAFIRCEHEAAVHGERLYDALVRDADTRPFAGIGDGVYAKFTLKKRILYEAEKVFNAFCFAQKALKVAGLSGHVDFIPHDFSFTLYRAMRRLGLLPSGIRVSRAQTWYLRGLELAKALYFTLKLSFFPERLWLKAKGEAVSEKSAYKVGVHVHSGRGFKGLNVKMDFFIDGEGVKKEDVLFVIDEEAPDWYVREVRESGYDSVNFFDDLVVSSSRKRYLRRHYARASSLRFGFLKRLLSKPWYAGTAFRAFRDDALWELFHDRYSVRKFFCLQHPGELTRVMVNRRHGSENVFVHNSITHDRLDRGANRECAEKIYYSHMIFDAVVADKVTNDWLRSHQNDVKNYVNNGSLFSDYVRQYRLHDKPRIRAELGIRDGFKLVSFFDHTVGHVGVMTYRDLESFLKSIADLLEDDPRVMAVFKMKKGAGLKTVANRDAIMKRVEDLKAHPRFVFLENQNVTSYELMGASDLVVSAPLSSVIYEAVIGGVRTVSYEAHPRYVGRHIITERFPRFSAHSPGDLLKLARYWLHEAGEEDFARFCEDHIKANFDPWCDGHAVDRFRALLLDGQEERYRLTANG